MSERERWKDLVDAIDRAAGVHDGGYTGDGHDIARAICEHLGIRWSDVDHLYSIANEANAYCSEHTEALADVFATLLEAAGIER